MPRSGADLRFANPRKCLQGSKGTRSVLPRQGQTFCLSESFRKGTGLFFSLVRKEPKVHQRSADLWTPGTVQIAGRIDVWGLMTGFYQVTGYAEVAIFHSIDGNDLNRC